MLKFTIHKDTWLRGESDSALLRPDDGKMCCLGQILSQSGVPNNEMAGIGAPMMVAHCCMTPEVRALLLIGGADEGANSSLADSAMEINDDFDINDDTRIVKLKNLFKSRGVTLVFK